MDALKGVRVVDFSKVLAGPLCTQYLGDMGADVIKAEPPQGDDTRRWPPFRDGDGTVFLSANRNKRSVTLDMKTPAGREAALRLIDWADVVVESYGPGVAQRLGIDYQTVSARRPGIVYCSISGFGSQGPLRTGKGYDVILQALSGMMAITGEEEGMPARSPISPIDQATGMHAVIGILAAIVQRQQTGKGTHIEASLFDTSMAFMAYVAQSYWERGTEPRRWGSAHESLCPYQAFETQDSPIMLGVANDTLWQAFCREVDAPELAADVRFTTNADRVGHRALVLEQVAGHLARESRETWLARFGRAGIPCAPILSVGDALAHPHTQASGMVAQVERPGRAPMNTISQPLRFDGQRPEPQRAPPELGEHTRQVFTELGYDQAQIDAILQPRTQS
ncbi:CaiB/BaiF CoA-transferase family protein [Bordetella sp. N]|uniref:CaiB/BaiF CoA transferase family protein n=1 Tax=Bordetella sp. N TaxID=1746199 RepID=UPI00070E4305|nr:CoA transferase [Bordetella sp. N]ALM86065.1 formyl-CoA transferase [Bordetella sp. N]